MLEIDSPLPSQAEMAAFDSATIASGVSSLELMERAGLAVLKELRTVLRPLSEKRVLILVGPGNNGGDGLVVACKLLEEGTAHRVLLVGSEKRSPDCITQLERYRELGGQPLTFDEVTAALIEELQEGGWISNVDCVVDALLGTGQRSELRESIKALVEFTNQYIGTDGKRSMRISVDLPTGVNGDTGAVYEPHFAADRTICIEFVKRGLLQYPARRVCGELVPVSIGISAGNETEFSLINRETVPRIPQRSADAHKGAFGRVLIAAGSTQMPGAAVLAAHAALRTGAGLVTKLHFDGVPDMGLWPEVMLAPVPRELGFVLSPEVLVRLSSYQQDTQCVVLGPGVGRASETEAAIATLLESRNQAFVIDADALSLIAEMAEALPRLEGCVLTPHPGEMARLLKTSTAEVQADRFAAVRELSKQTGAVVVLKGAGSLVYAGVRGAMTIKGNPYMATAGSGDVLSGVISGLIAQGLSPYNAAKAGIFVHGAAGDSAFAKRSAPLIASDLIMALGSEITRCMEEVLH